MSGPLRVLVVGGTSSRQFYGDKNAPLEIAEAMRPHAEVLHLPLQDHSRKDRPEREGVVARRPRPLDALRCWGHLGRAMRWTQGTAWTRRWEHLLVYALDLAVFRRAIRRFRPDVVHIHGDELKSVPIIEESIRTGTPFVVTVHLLYSLGKVDRDWDTDIEGPLLRRVQANGGRITFVSSANRRRAIEAFGLSPAGLEVVLNGCHVHPTPSGTPEQAVIQVGTLNERKNHTAVIEALPEVGGAFWVVGDGDQRQLIKAAAQGHGVADRVVLLGRLPDKELHEHYQRASGLVLPSLSEGLALVVLESLAHGRPVVLFDDLDGAEDLDFPLAVQRVPRSKEGLVEGLRWLLEQDHDPEQIQDVAKQLSWDAAAKRYLEVLRAT